MKHIVAYVILSLVMNLTQAALPETPADPPTVTATEVAPVEGVPATGDDATGTQGAQNG